MDDQTKPEYPVRLDGIPAFLNIFSRFKMPETPAHSLAFLMSEIGEFADEVTKQFVGYTRSDRKGSADIANLMEEAADVIIMTVVTLHLAAREEDVSINDALYIKLLEMAERYSEKEDK